MLFFWILVQNTGHLLRKRWRISNYNRFSWIILRTWNWFQISVFSQPGNYAWHQNRSTSFLNLCSLPFSHFISCLTLVLRPPSWEISLTAHEIEWMTRVQWQQAKAGRYSYIHFRYLIFTSVCIDITEPLSLSEECTYLLTCTDVFFPLVCSLPCGGHFRLCYRTFRIGIQFSCPYCRFLPAKVGHSNLIYSAKLLSFNRIHTAIYHPEANSIVEMFNFSLQSALRAMMNQSNCLKQRVRQLRFCFVGPKVATPLATETCINTNMHL